MQIGDLQLRLDADQLASTTTPLENNGTVYHGKQCVITAPSYIGARVDTGTTLSHDNRAGCDFLSAVTFDTKVLWIRLEPTPFLWAIYLPPEIFRPPELQLRQLLCIAACGLQYGDSSYGASS